MSNNHSIKILRGTRITVNKDNFADNEDKLYAGQPIYLTDLNYLAIGTADENNNSKVNKLPINARELLGYWDDNSGINKAVTASHGMWHIGPVDSLSKVEIRVGGKPLSIASSSSLNITQGDDSNDSNRYWKIYDSGNGTILNPYYLNIHGNKRCVYIKASNVTDDTAILIETGSTKRIDLRGGRVVLRVKSTNSGTEQSTERALVFTASAVGVNFGTWDQYSTQDKFYGASKRLIDAPSLDVSGDTITVTAGGQTSSPMTVPFATKASQLKMGTNTYYSFTKASTVPSTLEQNTIYLIY